jgi:tetratricopeptide (TPR) repeat protein
MKKIYLVFYVFLVGCSLNRISKRNVQVSLSDNKQIEYNYSFTEATKQKIFGNYSQAINLLNRCSEINEYSAAVYFQLSDIYNIVGDKHNALNFARIASRLDKKNIWYKVHLAHVYQINDKIDSTIYIYHKIVKSNPKYEYQFNYALLFVKKNNYKKAIRIIKKLERKYGLNKEIAVSLYKIYTIENNNKSAIKVLKESISKYPEESHFYGLIAEHYASMGANDLALQYYDKLLSLDPENDNGLLSLFEFYRSIFKYSEAIALVRKIIKSDIFNKEKKLEIVTALLNDDKCFKGFQFEIKGLCDSLIVVNGDTESHIMYSEYFLKANDLNNAKNELISIKNFKSEDIVYWEKLLRVLNSLGDYESIYKIADEAICVFKDKPSLYLFRGIAAYQLKKYEEALKAFNNGFVLIQNSLIFELQYYTFLGETYNALKDYAKSDSCFVKALNIDNQNVYILNNYSYYLAERSEKLDMALDYIRRCLEIEPKNYIYLDTYGWILFKGGNFDQAKNALASSINNGGSANSEIVIHYIQILIKLNLRDEAIKYYSLLKGMVKEDMDIKRLLKISD